MPLSIFVYLIFGVLKCSHFPRNPTQTTQYLLLFIATDRYAQLKYSHKFGLDGQPILFQELVGWPCNIVSCLTSHQRLPSSPLCLTLCSLWTLCLHWLLDQMANKPRLLNRESKGGQSLFSIYNKRMGVNRVQLSSLSSPMPNHKPLPTVGLSKFTKQP